MSNYSTTSGSDQGSTHETKCAQKELETLNISVISDHVPSCQLCVFAASFHPMVDWNRQTVGPFFRKEAQKNVVQTRMPFSRKHGW